MKSLIALVLLFVIVTGWDEIAMRMAPQPDLSNIENTDVVLYSTSWCGYCEKMRNFFKAKSIPYLEIDIEASSTAYDKYMSYNPKGIPLTVVKGEAIRGYNPSAVLSALRSNTATAVQSNSP